MPVWPSQCPLAAGIAFCMGKREYQLAQREARPLFFLGQPSWKEKMEVSVSGPVNMCYCYIKLQRTSHLFMSPHLGCKSHPNVDILNSPDESHSRNVWFSSLTIKGAQTVKLSCRCQHWRWLNWDYSHQEPFTESNLIIQFLLKCPTVAHIRGNWAGIKHPRTQSSPKDIRDNDNLYTLPCVMPNISLMLSNLASPCSTKTLQRISANVCYSIW